MTAAEFALFPEQWNPLELIDGEVVYPEHLTYGHQQVILRLACQIMPLDRAHDLGEWMGMRIDLFVSPYNVFQPDSTFWKRGHIPHPTLVPVVEIPAIAVEVLSPSSRSRDLGRKRVGYADRGIAEYWTLDPDLRRMMVSIQDESGVYVDHDVTGSTIPVGLFAGVDIDPAWIFEE